VKEIIELEKIACQVRRDILRMTNSAKSGHPGGSLGCADFMTVLFNNFIRNHPAQFNMDGKDEDVFILSNGHISPVLYSVMARKGYFPVSELGSFRKLGTRLQGHPGTHEGLPGIRIATGSLGQGLSVSIGCALSKRLNKDNHLVFCLMGDGELQEGQNWEALMFAAHNKVDNLIACIDHNKKQIDGSTDDVVGLGDLQKKIDSFGWKTLQMNGNKIDDIIDKIQNAISMTGNKQPICIIMNTKMGFGVDFMLDDHKWHGSPPNDEQLEVALKQLPVTLGDY
jgi:transketolase